MVFAAIVTPPSKNDTTTSMAALGKMMNSSQVESLTEVSDTGNRSRMSANCAIKNFLAVLSPLQCSSQSGAETVATNVLWIRKCFIPPLGKDVKASKNPMTQMGMEMEMLKAQWKVMGTGMVYPITLVPLLQ